jgi:tRNA 2-selenouridine synthase
MTEYIDIGKFLDISVSLPVVDVRTPSEFAQGHIPGACNIPLFSDQERKVVGTAYKRVSREAAMYAGLEFAGKKLVDLAKEGIRCAGSEKALVLHCWRGGMRSQSVAWLFGTMGIRCCILEGGYKTYRKYIHDQFEKEFSMVVIGGRTGSGKTRILHELQNKGEQIVDLEGLANHKGSAFGALGEEPQPTTEQFENDLGKVLMSLDGSRPVWIEDESRNVGKCVIPGPVFQRMKESRTVFLDVAREQRAAHLVEHYASYPPGELIGCIQKISKRLGGNRTREAIDSVERSDFFRTAMITLQYYDHAYMHALEKNHEHYEVIESTRIEPGYNAEILLGHVHEGENGL